MSLKLLFSQYITNDNQKFHLADLHLQQITDISAKQHSHDFFECFVVLQGEFNEHCGDEIIKLSAGSVHFLMPKTKHAIVPSNEFSQNILRNIAFKVSALPSYVLSDNNDFRFNLNSVELAEFKQKTDYCYTFLQTDKMRDYILSNIIGDLLIAHKMKNKSQKIPTWLSDTYNAMLLPENFMQGMKRFVDLSCVSHSHLCRSFANAYGCSPMQFIHTQRLLMACELLRSTDDKISIIALSCGFENLSFFNRLFSRTYGITPREYRRLNSAVFG